LKRIFIILLCLTATAYGLHEITGPLKDLSTRWTRTRLLYTVNDGNDVTQVDTLDDLTAFVDGTTNQITATNDGDGSVTLSTPQDIHTGASPTFADMTLSTPSSIYSLNHDSFTGFVANEHINHSSVSILAGTGLSGGGDITTTRTLSLSHLGLQDLADPGGDRIFFWDDSESKSDWLTTGDSVAITTTTLDTIQDIRTSASPTFAGVTISNSAVLGSDSAVFQPNTDSTTYFQVLDADGGTAVLNVDSTNERVGIGKTPAYELDVLNDIFVSHANGTIRANGQYSLLWQTIAGDSQGNACVIDNYRARNTIASPQTCQDTDWIGKWRYYQHNGAAYEQIGGMIYETVDVSTDKGRFRFYAYSGGVNDLVWIDNAGTRIGDADGSDYTEMEADGTVEFLGNATVWNDINVGAVMLALPAAGVPDEDEFVDEGGTDTGISTWAYAIGEKSSGALELEHFYKEGSDVYFHIHWQGITAPGGGTDNVNWQLKYTVMQDGETLDAATTITKEEAFTTQYDMHTHDFAAITGTNFNIGDQFIFTIERIAASGDDYAGDCLVATVGLHVECDTVGSRQITTK
jgi:hypothetical protein